MDKLMTDVMRNPTPPEDGRMPVVDLAFELDGVRYVKPAPRMPPSSFWPAGVAPRENTSGIDSCPPVARTFPSLSGDAWRKFREAMPAVERLKATYRDWLKACPDDAFESAEPLKPLVFVDVNFEDFTHWIEKPKAHWQFPDIEIFASEVCHQQAVSIMKAAMDKERSQIVPPAYVHLIINEIGNDKANDVGSVYYVSETPGFERRQALVENAKLFFEYGTAVAAAYAIKLKVSAVLFTKQRNR